MKKFVLLFLVLVGVISSYAQTPTYEYRLMNDKQVSSTVYEFDVYLKRTGSTTLEVANTQLGLNYNSAVVNGGTLTFSIVSGMSEFLSSQIPTSFTVDATNNILRVGPRTNPGAGNGTIISNTGNGTRLGRFRVTNSVSFNTVSMDLSWNFISTGGKYPSVLSAYVGGTATNITVQSSHYNSDLFNPILNVSISGLKFNDTDGDGTKDVGETGLSNWKIRLSKSSIQIDSVLTDGSGNYTFLGLALGTYTVAEEDKSGWAQSTTPSVYTVEITGGTSSTGINFGNYQYGSISGTKFDDLDGDGVKDGGESGLSGWKIRLSGHKIDSAMTDVNGNYTFSNLSPGTYGVGEEAQNGWIQTMPPSQGNYTVDITSGDVITGKDFGNFQTTAIAGVKFNDLNGNGVKDAGEPGLANWRIRLSLGGSQIDSQLTDALGGYIFTGLTAGTYTISEELQTNWVQSLPGESGTYTVEITSGGSASGKDFGNFQIGSIGGTKFNDLNGNGIKDGGEPGLSGWKIRLSGAKLDSLITDVNGNYSFSSLNPGSYTVSEQAQTGWVQTLPASGGNYSVNLTSGTSVTGKDFGNYQYGSISGTKFNDLNGNGIKDGGEPGLIKWRIRLVRGGIQVDSALTDASGNYAFSNLTAGTYTVSEVVQSGWTQTLPSSPGTYVIVVTSGTVSTGKDFGNYKYGTISGVKFNDLNTNGAKDGGEPGLINWRIRLVRGGVQVDSTLSDASGNYSFINLTAGTYTVSEALQNGWTQSLPTSPGTYVIAVTSGTVSTDKDFGNYQPGSISGMKFNDVNGNGTKDGGDLGLSGWRIRLARGGTPVDSALTDASSNYTFSNLIAGTYTVSEALQTGWLQTLPTSPGTYTIIITSGTVSTGKNFGNYQYGTISGTKFNDLNANGVKDASEPGLTNWQINLSGPISTSILTDVNGNYTFSDLTYGTYMLSEVLQSGWTQSMPSSPGTYSISVSSGTISSGRDFGNYHTGSISGTKFNDLNGNGVKDGGEPGLSGWRIRLSKNDAPFDSALTDGNGNYSFVGIIPASYKVTEALQTGWMQTLPSGSGIYNITLVSGDILTGKDFGNFQFAGISGLKFNDLNGNGSRDAGEPVLSGWTIRLVKGGIEVGSTTTDINGLYSFSSLSAGTYTVSEVVQSGWTQTMPSSPGTYVITVTSGTVTSGKDFGNFQIASISGTKFNDLNGNGVKDGGEPGLINWRIRLVKGGLQVDSTLTDASGNYMFNLLTGGTYTVSEAFQAGWTQTLPTSPGTYVIAITSGTVSTGKDFGNYQYGSISGMKFNDLNGNGIKDDGEPGLASWRIRLVRGGVQVDSALTDASGNYTFSGLTAGTYTVSEALQMGWTQTLPTSSGTYIIVITSGTVSSGKDFGNYLSGSISGTKFNDLNGDGIKDGGESPLSGWKIRLSGQKVDSLITDVNGYYIFSNLSPGTYGVSEEGQNGWIQTLPPSQSNYTIILVSGDVVTGKDFGNFQTTAIAGSKFNDLNGNGVRDAGEPGLANWRIRLSLGGSQIDSTLTDALGGYIFTGITAGTYTISEELQATWVQSMPGGPGTYTVVITSGGSASGKDFGNYQKGSISGIKFNDLNGNGIKDSGEPLLSGWKIKLSGHKLDSLLTDIYGYYLFTNLNPGTYTVSEEGQSGWIQMLPTAQGNYTINLTSGAGITGKDFGNFQYGSISGTKFDDLNSNGIKDAGEPGLSNWQIRLVKDAIEVGNALTDPSGNYTFGNLTAGTYTVSEVLQSGWMQILPPSPGTYVIAITSGTVSSVKDFGNFQYGNISGVKFDDLNGNGRKDENEQGIGNWMIRLNGTRTDSMETDIDGHYAFINLLVGDYMVSEAQHAGWYQTLPDAPGNYHLAIQSGSNHTQIDFGNSQFVPKSSVVRQGWNIISVPVIPVEGDYRKIILFPTAISDAFAYDGTYVTKDTLEPSIGYWLKFDSEQIINVGGKQRPEDTVSVISGWNLIGSLSEELPANTINSEPADIIESSFFGYDGQYTQEDTLQPLHGYWIKVKEPGTLIMSTSAGLNISRTKSSLQNALQSDDLNSIVITDANGMSRTLFFGSREEEISKVTSELPPLPPAQAFDVRFRSNRTKEIYSPVFEKPKTFTLSIQTNDYPVMVSWNIIQSNGFKYSLTEEKNGAVTGVTELTSNGSIKITNKEITRLVLTVISENGLPKEYALRQNYPNPFNPSTMLRYELPTKSIVKITIYNVLGQVIERLVDETEEAGYYEKKWTPEVASGIYFYRLEAQSVTDPNWSYNSLKKMVLVR